MVGIDENADAVLARFAVVPTVELNTLVQIEEIFEITDEMAQVFSGVVGVAVRSEDEIRRGIAMARAARHGDLLTTSPCFVEISGDNATHSGYLFSVSGSLWVSITERKLNFRLLPESEFKNCVLSPTEIQRIFIVYDEHGFFEARLESADRAVLATGALCDFIYGVGPARRTIGTLERPARDDF